MIVDVYKRQVLEDSRILLAKAGGETEKQIYRFNKGDSDLTWIGIHDDLPIKFKVIIHDNILPDRPSV